MEAKIYLQYVSYDDNLFSTSDDYYKDENAYMNAITEEYERNKDVVTNSILDMIDGSGGLYSGVDGNTYTFGQKTPQMEEKYSYTKCDCTIFNENGENESVDNIISKLVSQQPTVYMIELDRDTSDEEFEEELRMWTNDHNGINQYKSFKGDDWAWANEPVRNIKISFKNKNDETVNMMLCDCRILDIINDSSYILYIERMEMILNK